MTSSPPRLLPPDERLAFTLPDFTRLSWVSDGARSLWEPRLRAIAGAWAEIEWRSVATGLRRVHLTRTPPEGLAPRAARWAEHGLSVLPLAVEGAPSGPYSAATAPPQQGGPVAHAVAVGRLEDVVAFGTAWRGRDEDAMGALLGFPACCTAFYRAVWVEGRCVDTTWPMAQAGAPEDDARERTVAGPREANILWRWLGVRAVPHLPCSFSCEATATFGRALLELGREAGHGAAVDDAELLLDTSAEWSALHGIAELRTPIVRVTARTDATARRFVVRRPGVERPDASAAGLRFPYAAPDGTRRTESTVFQIGRRHRSEADPARAAWFHRDNGFSTAQAMRRLHAPLVAAARAALEGAAGPVVDLGCGNGALLAAIVDGRDELVPHGVDLAEGAIGHAAQVLPERHEHLRVGDLFAEDALPERAALAILMVGRLAEVEPPRAAALLDRLRRRCDRLLLYVYPDWSDRPFAALAAEVGLDEVPRDASSPWVVEPARG